LPSATQFEFKKLPKMNIWLSQKLAYFLGAITPILETVRRWHTWQENPPALFDDYILGGLLLYGAWRVGKDAHSGQKFLTAAWGFAFGMVYSSFFWQLEQNRLGANDPAPISGDWVAIVKGIGFIIVLIGFVTSLRKISD
jgi:hypothetical protein